MSVLNFEEVKIVKRLNSGLGGGTILISDGKEKYVVKSFQIEQGLNEYVAQRFIKAIDLPSIEVSWLKDEETYLGILKYEKNLKHVLKTSISSMIDNQRKILVGLFLVNYLLDNNDRDEYYFRKDEIVTLDFGEALVSLMEMENVDNFSKTPELKFLLLNSFSEKLFYEIFYSIRQFLLKEFAAYYTESEIDSLIELYLLRIKNLDLDLLEDVFIDISNFISISISNLYKDLFIKLKYLCDIKR